VNQQPSRSKPVPNGLGIMQQVALVPVVLHFWTSEVLAAVALIASPLASKHVRARLSDAIAQ